MNKTQSLPSTSLPSNQELATFFCKGPDSNSSPLQIISVSRTQLGPSSTKAARDHGQMNERSHVPLNFHLQKLPGLQCADPWSNRETDT